MPKNSSPKRIEIDDGCQEQVARIMGLYPWLVDTVKGRFGGDPFVVGLAATGEPPMWVVTEEGPGRQPIPDVCMAEASHTSGSPS
jgi:hypothetical protein